MENQPNKTQKSVTSAIIASFQVAYEISIKEQSITKHGRSGTVYSTKFDVHGYNQIDKEVGVFVLKVLKNGETTLYQFQDSTLSKAKPIN